MIAVWMLYCVALGLAFVVAGYALERGLQWTGRPTRWAWIVALVGSFAMPIVAWLRPEAFATLAMPMSMPMTAVESPLVTTLAPAAAAVPAAATASFSLTDLDGALRWGWAVSSVLVAILLARAASRLLALRRRWRRTAVDGRLVLVSPNMGPAVVGVWSPQVVLPEWALDLPESDRDLMLAHEEQHIRAHDPSLLAGAFLALVLAPWNLALWIQWRRLHLAVEMDCDARVLAQGRSAPIYGKLLLNVGRRRTAALVGAAAFGEPRSFLESRIRRLVSRLPRWRWVGAAGALLVAVGAMAAACETPRPLGPEVGSLTPLPPAPGVSGVVSSVISPDAVDQAPAIVSGPKASFPGLPGLAGIEGRVVLQATIETNGLVNATSVGVLASPHPALSESAKAAVLRSVFRPARINERPVRAVVQVVYDFIAAIPELTREAMDRAARLQAARLRPWVERTARQMIPAILEPSGPPMDAFLIHDARLQVYRVTLTTFNYLGDGAGRSVRPVTVAELENAFPPFDPGHDGWGVVEPRALKGLVRDNVRVIRIHHPPSPQDTARTVGDPSAVGMEQRASEMRRLARQLHPEVFRNDARLAAVALVIDAQGKVLRHAAGVRLPNDRLCDDVLTRLIPEFASTTWSQSGCADVDRQHKVVVYWGIPKARTQR